MQARHSALASFVTRARVAFTIATLCTLIVSSSGVAHAESDASVSTDPSGAHVQLALRGTWIEVRAPVIGSASGASSASTGCQRRWVPTSFPHKLHPGRVTTDIHSTPMPAMPGPEYVAYYVYCGATYLDTIWLAPNAFSPAAAPVIDVGAIAERLVRDLPYPATSIGISPDGRGLTGLESWFWVAGYSGPVRDAVDGFGMHVEVEAVPAAVRWDFGDATPARAGTLGIAAPARSDVVHTYEQRTQVAPVMVRASVRLDVRYRVDAGPWLSLEPVVRTATRSYRVVESRAALVAPR